MRRSLEKDESGLVEFHVKAIPLQMQSGINAAARYCVYDPGKHNSLGRGESVQRDNEHITRGDDVQGRTFCSSLFLNAGCAGRISSPALNHCDVQSPHSSRGFATESCDANDGELSLHNMISTPQTEFSAFGVEDAIQLKVSTVMWKSSLLDHQHRGNCDLSRYPVSTGRRWQVENGTMRVTPTCALECTQLGQCTDRSNG